MLETLTSFADHPLITLLVIVAFFILIFYLTREFWCWYFKINRMVQLLEEANGLKIEANGLQSEANELLEKIYNSNSENVGDERVKNVDNKSKNSDIDFSVIYTTEKPDKNK